MRNPLPRALGWLAVLASLGFGTMVTMDRPLAAQYIITCWKEYCWKDPNTGLTNCVKEQIPCPPPPVEQT
jgi:hypothetical protein